MLTSVKTVLSLLCTTTLGLPASGQSAPLTPDHSDDGLTVAIFGPEGSTPVAAATFAQDDKLKGKGDSPRWLATMQGEARLRCRRREPSLLRELLSDRQAVS